MSKGRTHNFTIDVYCQCRQFLFRYVKEGGGHLLKCFWSNISGDTTAGDGICPGCHKPFAREATIQNRPAWRIIQGRVYVKGHHG